MADAWPPGLSGVGGIPVVLTMSQRTCCAPPPGAADDEVTRITSADARICIAKPIWKKRRLRLRMWDSFRLTQTDLPGQHVFDREREDGPERTVEDGQV